MWALPDACELWMLHMRAADCTVIKATEKGANEACREEGEEARNLRQQHST